MGLTRQTQKVFASNADADQLAAFGTMKTGTPVYSSDLSTLQTSDYTDGWSEAILDDKAPYMEEMNAVQYGLSYQIAYILQQGLSIQYDANTTYMKGSIVSVISDTDVTFYKSIADNNTGNAVTNTTYWVLDSISKIETYYNTLNNAMVKLTGNQSIAGTKSFTGRINVPNATATGTALAMAARSSNAIKLGDGTLIQWGSSSTSSYYKTVSLDLAYSSSTSFRALVSDTGNDDAGYSYFKVIEYPSSKSFKVRSYKTAEADSFVWFTIGR